MTRGAAGGGTVGGGRAGSSGRRSPGAGGGRVEEEAGPIEAGKMADLAVVDLAGPHCQPGGPDPHATLVYCARASDVTDVLVDGRIVREGGRELALDLET